MTETLVVAIALGLVAGWFLGSLIGWQGDGPFNWRVFATPPIYRRWARRQADKGDRSAAA